MVEVDERQAAMLELAAGEMSLHHVRLIHGSDPNPSGLRRIGFAIRYIPTTCGRSPGAHDHATLVRGVDTYRSFRAGGASRCRHVAARGCPSCSGDWRPCGDPDARNRKEMRA